MKLSDQLFWDVDKSRIDYDKGFQWIICRVLERGTMDDWFAIKNYYGLEKIIEAAKEAQYLPIKSVHFISNVFEVPLTEFNSFHRPKCTKNLWYNQPWNQQRRQQFINK